MKYKVRAGLYAILPVRFLLIITVLLIFYEISMAHKNHRNVASASKSASGTPSPLFYVRS